MILVIDNFDSFTYNLVDYFERLGVNCQVYRNDVSIDVITQQDYSAVVISPGPETPEQAGNVMEILSYYEKKLPILGICLGHQAIGQFYGATLTKAIKPMHGKVSSVATIEDPIFSNLSSEIDVVRYHSLVLANLPDSLVSLSETKEGEIMVIKHKKLPIYGIQFHPESILTERGLDLLNNWLILNSIKEK